MKHTVFHNTPSQKSLPSKKRTDYVGIIFVSLVLFSSASCFLLDSHQESTVDDKHTIELTHTEL